MSHIINPFRFGGGAFSPADVSGLYQWLDASQLSLSDNDAVSSWTDESGNGRHATQGTGGNQPIFKTGIVNSLPVIRFDGTDDFLSLGDFSAFTEGEAFVVFKLNADPPATSATTGFWWMGNTASAHFPWTDGVIYDDFGNDARKTTVDPTPALTSWRVYNVYSAANDWQSFIDGVSQHSTGTNTVYFAATAVLGHSASTSYHLDGDVAEFILYSNKLSGGDRAAVQSYLDTKYAL